MNSRERIAAALNHQEPDRIPLDLGGCATTGSHVSSVYLLRQWLGILLLANLACRPVLTIGWQEIGILVLLLAFTLGPALFRLARRWEEFSTWKDKKDKQPPDD